jgi:hypothetical protein
VKNEEEIMETMELNMKDVAEPDLFASGTAVTGQENNAWRMLTRGFFPVNIGEPGLAFCTTTRWVRRLQRQITKLEERNKIREAKRPAIRTVVWR